MRLFTLTILIAIALVFCGMSTVIGQDKKQYESPVSIRQIHNPGIEFNQAILNFGLDYLLTLKPEDQIHPTAATGNGNMASINMYGDQNFAGIQQVGTGNQAFIQLGMQHSPVTGNNIKAEQTGHQLLSITDVQGSKNKFSFHQQGLNVGAVILLRGDYMQFKATQEGSTFLLQPLSSTLPLMNISTTRQVLPLVISN